MVRVFSSAVVAFFISFDGNAEAREGETMSTVAEQTDAVVEPGGPGGPVDEAAILAASFAEGFSGKETEPPQPEASQEEQSVVKPAVVDQPPGPKYVQLTEDEHRDLLKIRDLQGKLDTGFGTLGQLQQTMKELRESWKTGAGFDVSDDDFAELKAEFPELAAMYQKGMNRILQRLKVPTQVQALDEGQLKDKISMELAAKELEDEYPDWRTIVGPAGTETPFRQWVSTLHEVDQKKIWGSRNPRYLARQLDKFTEAAASKPETKPPEKPLSKLPDRTAQLKAAVPVKRVTPPSSPVDEGGFSSGFAEEFKAMGLKS
jgi:hypothetical protein